MKICNEIDCPLHSDYTDSEIEEVVKDENSKGGYWATTANQGPGFSVYSGGNGGLGQSSTAVWTTAAISTLSTANIVTLGNNEEIKVDNGIKFKTNILECNLECLFCIYNKKVDMKNELIVAKTKKLLEK